MFGAKTIEETMVPNQGGILQITPNTVGFIGEQYLLNTDSKWKKLWHHHRGIARIMVQWAIDNPNANCVVCEAALKRYILRCFNNGLFNQPGWLIQSIVRAFEIAHLNGEKMVIDEGNDDLMEDVILRAIEKVIALQAKKSVSILFQQNEEASEPPRRATSNNTQ